MKPSTIITETFRSTEQWRAWLDDEAERFLRGYENDPRRLLSDRAGERNASRDYHGREILELLQNANDAAAEKGENSSVHLQLTEAGLIVANTGVPFHPQGITSLMLANLSPKPRNNLLIGNKGLGFRAVLNWSSRPIILSGALKLGFAPEFAAARETRIRGLLGHSIQETRLPVLQFPAFLDLLPGGLPDEWYAIHGACEECRHQYDTAIGLPFERQDAFVEASSQIAALGPEVLLFVKHLDAIEIVVPNVPKRIWQIARQGNEAIVSENSSQLKSWTVWSREGEILPALVLPDGPSQYELAIAIPEAPSPPRRLFCHFETQVNFPYPVVCHASFELDQARNHIIQGGLNEFVLQQLAALHSRVAEEVAERDQDWKGGKLALCAGKPMELFPHGDYNALLIENLKHRRFIPCIDGKLRSPTEARFVSQASPHWLPKTFGEIANVEDFPSAIHLLSALDVKPLGPEEWLDRIEQLDFTDNDQLAKFTAGLIKSDAIKVFKSKPPYLLTDSRGERIHDGRVYVSGSKERGLLPPGWLSIRFLNPLLRERLQNLLGASDVRDFAARLRMHGFDAEEYNTVSVSGAAVTQAENYIAANPATENTVRHELLYFLFQLFLSVRGSETDFRPIARLQVPNQAGGWTPAIGAHFSEDYGNDGRLLHALYSAAHPELLVASPKVFSWANDKDADALGAFLKWIGVHSLPKEFKSDSNEHEFLQYVKAHIPASFRVTRGEFCTHNDIKWNPHVEMFSIIGLSDILATATPGAILEWVSKDGRWGKWTEPSKDHGSFRFIPPGCSTERTYDGPIPSYPHWLIQRSPWLTGDDSQKHPPNQMLLSDDTRISGAVSRPAIRSSERLSEESILSALYRVGLAPNISALHPAAFYAALRKCELLPIKSAYGFYRFIIEERKANADRALMESSERATYIRDARLWCDFEGSARLVSIDRCRYRRGDDIPKGISLYVPLVMLPVKRGAERVEKLFGVKPLKDSGYQIRKFLERDGSVIIQGQFSHSVESILLLRNASGRVDWTQQDALEKLQVHVCSEVTAVFIGEGLQREVNMANNEWVLTNGNRYLYVVCAEGNDVSLKNESLVNAVVEALASIFGISDASQFARLIQAADDQQRLSLLATLLGEAPEQIQEQLEQMRIRLESQQRAGRIIPPAIEHLPSSNESEENLEPEPGSQSTEEEEDARSQQGFDGTGRIKVEPLEHAAQTQRRVRLRVTNKTADTGKVTLRYSSRANGEEAERIAEAFERADGRFPVRVGDVQGTEGSGCDILSFDTEEQARAARSRAGANPFESARRIIEVKGRKDQSARIVLDGYEYDTACERSNRYFLYRVYADEETGTWQIAVLQNPAHTYSAHVNTFVISFEKTDATKRFRISVTEEIDSDGDSAACSANSDQTKHPSQA